MIFIQKNIITIDKTGTQTAFTKKSIEEEANYILVIRDNQKQLFQDIKDEFQFGKSIQINENIDFDKGCIETRI